MRRGRKKQKDSDDEFTIDEDTMQQIIEEDAVEDVKSSKKRGFLSAYKERIKENQSRRSTQISSQTSKGRISVPKVEEDLHVKEINSEKAEEIYLKIKEWRSKNKAVVDTQGAEQHYNEEDNPNEQAFQVMVGVLLSVQSNDIVTDRVMKSLLKDGVSIKKYAELTTNQIQQKIKGINFNKNKSIFIQSAAKKIIDDFDGKVPSTLKELTSFRGIGPKVAHLILQIGFSKTTGIAVDTHVHRISNRLGFVKWTKDATKTMERLQKKFDKKYWEEININLVGFGQLICGKLRPKCELCPVRNECALGTALKDIEDIGKKDKKFRVSKVKKIIK